MLQVYTILVQNVTLHLVEFIPITLCLVMHTSSMIVSTLQKPSFTYRISSCLKVVLSLLYRVYANKTQNPIYARKFYNHCHSK